MMAHLIPLASLPVVCGFLCHNRTAKELEHPHYAETDCHEGGTWLHFGSHMRWRVALSELSELALLPATLEGILVR